MAWQPSTTFEEDLVDLQPNHNFVHGQLAYEDKLDQKYVPRPQAHYDFLMNRQKRNEELEKLYGPVSAKSKEIRAGLAMMERIQQISGTKPLGEHATVADLEDRSTVEQEAVAMMRHFGMMSMADGALIVPNEAPPLGRIHIMGTGRRTLPLLLDPAYFEPCKRSSCNNSSLSSSNKTSDSSSKYFSVSGTETPQCDGNSLSLNNQSNVTKHLTSSTVASNSSNYTTCSSTNDADFQEIPHVPLKIETRKKKTRPNQPRRKMSRKRLYNF